MRLAWSVLLTLAWAAPAAAAPGTAVVPLTGSDAKLTGLPTLAQARFHVPGSTLASVGDVNGDGLEDVAVAAPSADVRGRRDAGAVHVVFGGSRLGRIDLGSAGFQILGPRQGARRPVPAFAFDGPPAGAMAGSAIAGAGDVDGDGLDDLLVAAPFAGNRGRAFSGSAYVVFGKRSRAPVDLDRLGAGGFRIDGPRRGGVLGFALAGPGDVSGDGRPDIAVSARDSTTYVVHGKTGRGAVDLRRLGRRGFAIRGHGRALLDAGATLSGAGDFNGDGVEDIAVAAPQSGPTRRDGAGFTFVVFGGKHRRAIELGALRGRGVRITGEHEFSNLGEALAPLGDVNGDGRADLLIGASQVSLSDRRYAGAAYVVLGRAGGRVDLRHAGRAAYRMIGPRAGGRQARAGMTVAAIPDVNGDGRTDMLIGAPGAGRRCSPEEGAAYVVFTPATPGPIDLDDLGGAGYALGGEVDAAGAGAGVASAGDWNRDGRGDALVLSTDFDERPTRPPRLDLVLGRMPPAVPPAPAPDQLPRIEIPRPTVRELLSREGLEARVAVGGAGPRDTLFTLVNTFVFGDALPLAATLVRGPGPRTVRLRTVARFRRAIRNRTRLPVQVVLSHCTTSGYEHTVTRGLVLTAG